MATGTVDKTARAASVAKPEGATKGGFLPSYKPDQGRYARMFGFWVIAFLAIYGATRFAPWLRGKDWGFAKVDSPYANNWFDLNLLGPGGRLPIIGFYPTYANLIVSAILLVFLYWWLRFLNRPRQADLLIDTEMELRKVTWPTWPETWNSTLVVISTVIVLMLFLMLADWFFGQVVRVLFL